jgi:hypothetical protein
MQRAAQVASEELAELLSDFSGVVIEVVDCGPMSFDVRGRTMGREIHRMGDLRDGLIWDEIETDRMPPELPRGARVTGLSRISVELRRGLFPRPHRLSRWTTAEVRDLCRGLNAVTERLL